MKKIKSIIAVILSAAMLSSMTTIAYAETSGSEVSQPSFADVKGEVEKEGNIVKELPEGRTEYTSGTGMTGQQIKV